MKISILFGLFCLLGSWNLTLAESRDIIIQEAQRFVGGQKKAVVVGISQYNTRLTGLTHLKFADLDALQLRSTLTAKHYKVTPLVNHQATKNIILSRIREVGKTFKRGTGTFIFSFAGHGFAVNGQTYLATADAIASSRQELAKTGLSLREVIQAIRQTGVRRAMLFIDACRNNPVEGSRGRIDQRFANINPGKGIQILYATGNGALSWESPQLRKGVFTYFLDKALNKNPNGIVLFSDVAKDVEQSVRNWTSQNMATTQQPYRSSAGDYFGDFVLASPLKFLDPHNTKKQVAKLNVAFKRKDYKTAYRLALPLAQKGNVVAQNYLGVMYYKGLGINKDYKKAFKWFHKSAMSGDREAQLNLAHLYYLGLGTNKNYQKAVEWYRKLAMKGDSDAQRSLGVMYDKDKNYKKAFEWFRKSAMAGNSIAQCDLGNYYYQGLGTNKNYKKAFEWYRKSAIAGNSIAQYNLGNHYYQGLGINKNYKKAVEWYRKSAIAGDSTAQYNLGYSYLNGPGVNKNYQKAIDWYRKSVAQGNTSAQINLAIMYATGTGIAKNYRKAFDLFHKAALKENKYAYINLGRMYEEGKGVKVNLPQARKWYAKASQHGIKDATKAFQRVDQADLLFFD